jgi:hypothetical protein
MARTPIIYHGPIGRRRIVRHFGLSCDGPEWPLTEASETRELDSKQKNQPDER